jgi:GntR family phosphonate transport system transcriptional regulator
MTKVAVAPESQLGGVALWRQIADALRLDIVGGRLAAGDRLEGELPLAARFGVNRHTVRRAIRALADEGVVKVEHGRGTFVAEARRLSYPIGRRTRFTEGLAGQARETRHELLSSRVERAPVRLAKLLGLKPGARLVRLETLAFADGRTLAYGSGWFPEARFPTIAETYAETHSTTAALKRLGVDDYSRASTRISARHADLEESRALKLAPGTVVLVSEAVDVDDAGIPIQAMLTRFPADRLELVV